MFSRTISEDFLVQSFRLRRLQRMKNLGLIQYFDQAIELCPHLDISALLSHPWWVEFEDTCYFDLTGAGPVTTSCPEARPGLRHAA
jgi:hypothetical protein